MNVKPVVWGSLTRKAAAPVGDCRTGTTGWLTATYDVTMPPELADHLQPPTDCKTSGGTAPDGSVCHFPFVHDGTTYNICTDVNHDTPWCYTNQEKSSWGECPSTCGRLPPGLPQNTQAYRIDVRGHLDQEVEHCVVGVQDTTLTFKYARTYGVRKVKVTFPFDALFPYEGVHCPCRDALSEAACASLRNAGNCDSDGYQGKARVFAASPPSGGLCSRGRPRVRRPRSTLERLSRRSVPR